MSYDYDRLYRETPDALGAPDARLLARLTRRLPAPARVLDLGCGQGRDAIALARMGYAVTGVDTSPNGIAALRDAAAREGLAVTGVVADLAGFTPDRPAEALLFDRSLHMLDDRARSAALARLLAWATPGGWCLIADEPANITDLRQVLEQTSPGWDIVEATRNQLLARRGDGAG